MLSDYKRPACRPPVVVRDAHGPMEDITHRKRVVHAMEEGEMGEG